MVFYLYWTKNQIKLNLALIVLYHYYAASYYVILSLLVCYKCLQCHRFLNHIDAIHWQSIYCKRLSNLFESCLMFSMFKSVSFNLHHSQVNFYLTCFDYCIISLQIACICCLPPNNSLIEQLCATFKDLFNATQVTARALLWNNDFIVAGKQRFIFNTQI